MLNFFVVFLQSFAETRSCVSLTDIDNFSAMLGPQKQLVDALMFWQLGDRLSRQRRGLQIVQDVCEFPKQCFGKVEFKFGITLSHAA
ncbi:hypothetical protein ASD89_06720 [Caulobacter sp. Root656]|nr:hypothetical protein ASD89_06720 [Caulobacter sp. Root656]